MSIKNKRESHLAPRVTKRQQTQCSLYTHDLKTFSKRMGM